MGLTIGDAIFDSGGRPGVLVKKDPITGDYKGDLKPETVKKNHRHGYINGLAKEERSEFLRLMDEVSEAEKPEDKIMLLKERIDKLMEDPKKSHMMGYLESELSHIMNTYNVKPRYFNISASRF